MTAKRLTIWYIFFLVLISFNFFEAKFLSKNLTLYFQFLYIAFTIAISLPFMFRKAKGFVLPIQLIFLSTLISIIMAYISWGQSIMESILATVPFMLWIFFFYLLQVKFPVKQLENIILFYGFLYCLLYLYQYMHASTPFFGSQDEFTEDRGVIRIIFPGGGIFYLASFLAINKLTAQPNNKWLWLLFSMLGIVCTLMQVTRQAIFGVFLLFFYHLIKDFPTHKKIAITVVCIFGLYFLSNSSNPIVKGIVEAQKTNANEGANYIRVEAGTYFLKNFSPNNVSRIFGNGVPYALQSTYALFVANLQQDGFYLSDVGMIAMYVMFGILPVLAFILIWIRSFTIQVPKEFYYVKYYLWYLLITCLTSNSVYDTDYLISTVFALYIYQTIYEKYGERIVDPNNGLQLVTSG